ncbi:polyisoprenoid-binding protein [Polymorphobacter multimanifer]|uniref:Polyisoprenoid-binding protein YceI n=2 Tax=Polymorphobacter multimanifer TaxID=1070431 RepID=A0A841LA55_9SPHN|nr:YceI family protein [Polymorphobacter multimanifer]MBB6227843.1 polyisoprenoid-binding protein YceI [Polymorphobacter multimanifer]GGI77410.1 polyisoprenoid-binding protein [Polymorphobacter multimanifer]
MRVMMLAAALLMASPVLAQPAGFAIPSGAYEGDPAHTSVTFKIEHFGLSFYTARFAKVSSKVMLDAARPEASKLEVSIDARSVRTDFPFPEKTDFDKEIGTDPKFLDGNTHPTIGFVSTKVTKTGASTADITGNLTLRGVTKPVVLKAVLNGQVANHPMMKKPVFGISATTVVRRADFGLTAFEGVLGDNVTVLIEAEYGKTAG